MRWPAPTTKPPAWYAASQAQRYGIGAADATAILAQVETQYLGPKPGAAARARFRAKLHLEELVLARACARGHEAAWEEFWRRYRSRMRGAARSLTHDAVSAEDLADGLFAELFGLRERNGERISKLNSYTGIGSLDGWLCALLAQAHVDQWRRQRRLVALDESERLLNALAAPQVSGADAMPAQRRQVEIALESVLRGADGPSRLLLSLYFLDGQTLAQIGILLRVHESTVSRRLERVLSQLRRHTRRELGRQGLPARVRDEVMRLDPLWLQVDVRTLLQPAAAGRPPGTHNGL